MREGNEFFSEIRTLIEEKNFAKLRLVLSNEEAVDLAEILCDVSKEQRMMLYRILPKELAADVFVEMDPDLQMDLINSFSDIELKSVLDELYIDDTADIIEEMPASVVKRILKNSSSDTRKELNELLKYPESCAGSIMTTEYVSLKGSMIVEQAISHIRDVAIDKETIYNCYVTDLNRVLIGIVSIKDLLISNDNMKLEDIMQKNVLSVYTLDERETVARLFDRYDYLALPVVDGENRLVGIITVDDAIDVLHDEAEEDFAKMAAITPAEKPYLRMSVIQIWKTRIPWLLILMISATFTGMIISSFETALQGVAALTIFIPMLMDTGGNSGSQASVTVIRGLSLGEIGFSDALKVIWKEMRVSLLCGFTLAVIGFGKILLVDRLIMGNEGVSLNVAFVVSATLCITVLVAKLIGCSLPIMAKKLGFDPAVMASPFITTIVDAISLIVYFAISGAVLNI
jgi:magnesium transporter